MEIYSFLAEGNHSELFEKFENNYSIHFPNLYKELLRCYDYVTLKNNFFLYASNIDYFTFLPWQERFYPERLEDELKTPPEFFPDDLIPFASNGGGDYICFDYRSCKKNPPIVFWRHESPQGDDVFFLADSFEEFISNLKSEEEVEALERNT